MALTLAELQQQRDDLVKTIGLLRVQFGDRSVEYVAEKAKAIAEIDAEIARLQGVSQSRQFTIQTSRGL